VRFRFGDCELDVAGRLLLRRGEPAGLTPKAFDLLVLLLRKRPEVVSKADILEALWPETYVAEANIPNLIAELRGATGDSARKPRYIRTSHRTGYAFCGTAFEHSSLPNVVLPPACSLVGQGNVHPLPDGDHVIGRGSDCDVHVAGGAVSRRHAKIRVRGTSAVLEDLHSRNGTFVGGRKISAPTPLTDGDTLRIGDASLRFRLFDPRATTVNISLKPSAKKPPTKMAGRPRRILGRS
jgi:DNA-binding winged helix-turn-helix (wHTH) protein